MNKNVMVFGLGYVGLSNAILLAQHNQVVGIEINKSKVDMLNNKKSPIVDAMISDYLEHKSLNISFKQSDDNFIKIADYIIISTPTNFDEEKNFFDTSSVESVIDNVLKINKDVTIVIKSTIPIGFMDKMSKLYPNAKLLFSPEFLREGQALHDNLYPSRIIVGYNKNDQVLKEKAQEFTDLLFQGSIDKNCPIFTMGYKEAESVKLFANTYLAMRVAYINELDNFALEHDLNTKDIVSGICADPRIGNFYNNPSFGYGGYCFPKDTKQLFANYEGMPNELIRATVESNNVRKEYLANHIINHTKSNDNIGIYRLVMKSNSDNCRASAIFDIIKKISKQRKVLIYEPTITEPPFENCVLINNIQEFKEISDMIVANRIDNNLLDVAEKVYTRDIFNRD